MYTHSTPTPRTIGKLLGQAIALYPTHSGILLRTAAIFYLPVAALSFLFVENLATNLIFSLVIWPVDAIVSLSLIAHCIDLLHGRPLAVRTAIMRALRRLPAYLGISLAMTAVSGAVVLVLAAPLWVGLLNSDVSLGDIIDTFSAPANPGSIALIMSVLSSTLWGGAGVCLSGVLIPIVLFYLLVRWRVAEVALMAERTGPLQSLRRSWNLSRGYVLRTFGYFLLIAIAMGLVGAVVGVALTSLVNALVPTADQSRIFGLNFAFSKLMFIIAMPFYVTTVVLYYFDLRVRKEKFDFDVPQ